MSLDQTANFVRATLASAIAAGDSTIALADSGQLVDPANGEYNLVVWDPSSYPRPGQDPAVEIVRATTLDSGTNTLTVDRGQEGTAAADHAVEAVLQLSPTAKMFSDIDAKTSALSDDGQTFAGDAIDVGTASVEDTDTDSLTAGAGSVGDSVVGPFHPDLEITNILGGNRNPNNKPVLLPTSGDKIILVYRDSPTHVFSTDSVIRMLWSNDNGKSWYNHDKVFTEADSSVDVVAPGGGLMDNGRIGFFVGRRTAETDFIEPSFVYSDDDGYSWTVTTLSDEAVSFGQFHRYPSSVGGADNGGWIIFSYDRTNEDIIYFTTTDNGDTWTKGVAYDMSADSALYIEHDVMRVGTDDRWLAVARSTNGGNARIFKTSDLTNWDGPFDSGQPLDENHPHLEYYNGHAYLMAASRAYFNREISDYGDALLHQSTNAEAVWDDPSAWGEWSVAYRPRGTVNGYGELREINGEWMGAMSVSEDQPDSSMIGLLRQSESTDPNIGMADFHVKDDFGDAGASPSVPINRPASTHSNFPTLNSNLAAARYRPAWMFHPFGEPSINGDLSFPSWSSGEDPKIAHTVSELDEELTLEFDFTVQSTTTTGSLSIFPQTENPSEPIDSGDAGFYIAIRSDGSIAFSERGGGNTSEFFSGTWDNDTNRHSIELTRSAVGDEWELTYDGTSIGTATDSETFNPNIVFRNQLDAGVSIHHLLVTE
jgi:hypothetical protein